MTLTGYCSLFVRATPHGDGVVNGPTVLIVATTFIFVGGEVTADEVI